MVVCLPVSHDDDSAPFQGFHHDVGFLHPRTMAGQFDYSYFTHISYSTIAGEKRHMPPHGVVVIIPFVNVTKENGPTEFITGSHVNVVCI